MNDSRLGKLGGLLSSLSSIDIGCFNGYLKSLANVLDYEALAIRYYFVITPNKRPL